MVGDPDRRIHWPTWIFDRRGLRGPRDLGSWFNHVPSDWEPADDDAALPELRDVLDRIAQQSR